MAGGGGSRSLRATLLKAHVSWCVGGAKHVRRTKGNAISGGCGRHRLSWVAQTPDKGGLASSLVANDDERASTSGGLAAVVLGDVRVDGGVIVGELRREASESEGGGGESEACSTFEPLVGWAFHGSREEGGDSGIFKVVA